MFCETIATGAICSRNAFDTNLLDGLLRRLARLVVHEPIALGLAGSVERNLA